MIYVGVILVLAFFGLGWATAGYDSAMDEAKKVMRQWQSENRS